MTLAALNKQRITRIWAGLMMVGWASCALATTAGTTSNPTSGCWMNTATQTAVNANTAIAAQQIRAANAPMASGPLQQCLSQIQNLGAAFNFDFPTNLFGSLLSQACTMGASTINAATNTYINQNIQYPGIVQAGVGAGQSGFNYSVNNNSSAMANTIWNQAVGPGIP